MFASKGLIVHCCETCIPDPGVGMTARRAGAETLKYAYLLFSPSDELPFDLFVLNTEAHPLRISGRSDARASGAVAASAYNAQRAMVRQHMMTNKVILGLGLGLGDQGLSACHETCCCRGCCTGLLHMCFASIMCLLTYVALAQPPHAMP